MSIFEEHQWTHKFLLCLTHGFPNACKLFLLLTSLCTWSYSSKYCHKILFHLDPNEFMVYKLIIHLLFHFGQKWCFQSLILRAMQTLKSYLATGPLTYQFRPFCVWVCLGLLWCLYDCRGMPDLVNCQKILIGTPNDISLFLHRCVEQKVQFLKMVPILIWHSGFSMAVTGLFHFLEEYSCVLRILNLNRPHLNLIL